MQTNLEKMRRLIESHMERFKETERQSKIKAFSTEALRMANAQGDIKANDPKFKTLQWMKNVIQKLQEMGEMVEAEAESLGSSGGNKVDRANKIADLEEKQLFYANHVEKLEMVMRLITNNQVETDVVDEALKESFEYYIETHDAADDDDSYLLDESIYDDLPLELCETNIKIQPGKSSGSSAEADTPHASATTTEQKKEEAKDTDKTADTHDTPSVASVAVPVTETKHSKSNGTDADVERTPRETKASSKQLQQKQQKQAAAAAATAAAPEGAPASSAPTPSAAPVPPAAERDVPSSTAAANAWTSSNKTSIIKNLASKPSAQAQTQAVPTPPPPAVQNQAQFHQQQHPAAVRASSHIQHQQHVLQQQQQGPPLVSAVSPTQTAVAHRQHPHHVPSAIHQQQQRGVNGIDQSAMLAAGHAQMRGVNDNQHQMTMQQREEANRVVQRLSFQTACLEAAMANIPTEDDLNLRSGDRVNGGTRSWPPVRHPVSPQFVPESFPTVALKEQRIPEIIGKNVDTLFFSFYFQQVRAYASFSSASVLP